MPPRQVGQADRAIAEVLVTRHNICFLARADRDNPVKKVKRNSTLAEVRCQSDTPHGLKPSGFQGANEAPWPGPGCRPDYAAFHEETACDTLEKVERYDQVRRRCAQTRC